MGLFKKKEESSYSPGLPELPKLPELPELPEKEEFGKVRPNALPRFPSNSLADKFSQNTIKDAISGQRDDNEDAVEEFEDEIQNRPQPPALQRNQKMPQLPSLPSSEDDDDDYEETTLPSYQKTKTMEQMPSKLSRGSSHMSDDNNEPIFIRLDKFEESMAIFEKIKKQMSNVDKLLEDIKSIKEKEDDELKDWQGKLETMKGQIEKIDRDIFSKLE
jgi:predicted ribosome quality control (RQC) complex YloA/Tae2 family protein